MNCYKHGQMQNALKSMNTIIFGLLRESLNTTHIVLALCIQYTRTKLYHIYGICQSYHVTLPSLLGDDITRKSIQRYLLL